MSDIKSWSNSAGGNTSASPDGFPENMAPSGVNDAARELMAAVRRQWESAEWFDYGDTPSRASATTFKVATDLTTRYVTNRGVRCSDATTLTGHVVSSSYTTETTVTVSLGGSLTTSLTAVALSILDPANTAAYIARRDSANSFSGAVTMQSTLTVSGATVLQSTLSVSGASAFNSGVTIGGTLSATSVYAGTLYAGGTQVKAPGWEYINSFSCTYTLVATGLDSYEKIRIELAGYMPSTGGGVHMKAYFSGDGGATYYTASYGTTYAISEASIGASQVFSSTNSFIAVCGPVHNATGPGVNGVIDIVGHSRSGDPTSLFFNGSYYRWTILGNVSWQIRQTSGYLSISTLIDTVKIIFDVGTGSATITGLKTS